MTERILLFGGTFDPVHCGHLITARAVAEALDFPRAQLVPAAIPPHKAGTHASAADRLEMLKRATAGDELFEICTLELFRSGASYTYDTLVDLREQYGPAAELHWVVGADMLESLDTWHRAREVLALARIVVAARPPWHQRLTEIFLHLQGRIDPDQLMRLKDFMVATPLVDISSTEIRRRVAAGRSIRYLVPDSVDSYIHEAGLYL